MVLIFFKNLGWGLVYLFFYGLVIGVLCFRLYDLDLHRSVDAFRCGRSEVLSLLYIWYDFLSLGGMPPRLGWVPKLIGLFELSKYSLAYIVILCICRAFGLLAYSLISFEICWRAGARVIVDFSSVF